MTRSWIIVLVVATASVARADDPPPADCATVDHLAAGRALYENKDFAGARSEMLAAYACDPQPALLFALGQVELNLEHFQAAIDYYEQFLATGPDEHDTSLAQQGLGAARTGLTRPPIEPKVVVVQPPPIVTRRRWGGINWALTAGGVVGLGAGAGLIWYGHHQSTDRSGSIAEYDDRLHSARRMQWIGLGVSVAGVAALATAFIRYGVHRERVEIGVGATPDQVGVTVSGSL